MSMCIAERHPLRAACPHAVEMSELALDRWFSRRHVERAATASVDRADTRGSRKHDYASIAATSVLRDVAPQVRHVAPRDERPYYARQVVIFTIDRLIAGAHAPSDALMRHLYRFGEVTECVVYDGMVPLSPLARQRQLQRA